MKQSQRYQEHKMKSSQSRSSAGSVKSSRSEEASPVGGPPVRDIILNVADTGVEFMNMDPNDDSDPALWAFENQ